MYLPCGITIEDAGQKIVKTIKGEPDLRLGQYEFAEGAPHRKLKTSAELEEKIENLKNDVKGLKNKI